MSWDEIGAAVQAAGLGVVGAFHPVEDDGAPREIATLLLLGPVGPAMWQAFRAAPEAADGLADPLDRWSRRVVGGLADRFGGAAFFPFGGPPWHSFQRWAARGEGAVVSPVAMQASPSRGLWASYRGALGFAGRLALPQRSVADPCLGCPAPCLTACPVDAFAGGDIRRPRLRRARPRRCWRRLPRRLPRAPRLPGRRDDGTAGGAARFSHVGFPRRPSAPTVAGPSTGPGQGCG